MFPAVAALGAKGTPEHIQYNPPGESAPDFGVRHSLSRLGFNLPGDSRDRRNSAAIPLWCCAFSYCGRSAADFPAHARPALARCTTMETFHDCRNVHARGRQRTRRLGREKYFVGTRRTACGPHTHLVCIARLGSPRRNAPTRKNRLRCADRFQRHRAVGEW